MEIDWSHFSHSNLKNVRFDKCNIYNASFQSSMLVDCKFIHCILREVMFVNATIQNSCFDRSDLLGCSFEDAKLSQLLYTKCSMAGTHFLQTSLDHCTIHSSDLQDTVFFGNEQYFKEIDAISTKSMNLTRPIRALICPLEIRGISMPKAFIKIEHSAGLIPIRISAYPTIIYTHQLLEAG